jgi:hypothetical protein
MGDSALQRLSAGNDNVAIGVNASSQNLNGVRNVAIGNGALYTNFNSNNVAIGYNAGYNEGGSSKLYIENSNADKDNALIFGDFAADSLTLNGKTVVRDNAVVRGFTKLGGYGTEVPNIKMKTITGTTPAVDNFASYATGIADAKVLSFDVLVEYAGGWKMPPSYRDAAGYEYNVQFQSGNLVIINKSGNSANIGAKPFRVLITYEQ